MQLLKDQACLLFLSLGLCLQILPQIGSGLAPSAHYYSFHRFFYLLDTFLLLTGSRPEYSGGSPRSLLLHLVGWAGAFLFLLRDRPTPP